jgi:large subunit ribosomal protein L21
MYAVFRSGGKQYRVSPGASVRLEKLPGEVGSAITLDEVLMLGPDAADAEEGDVKIGAPTVDGARVTGTITAQGRGPKLTVFKMKRRKGYRRKYGHRQDFTEIRVDQIEGR